MQQYYDKSFTVVKSSPSLMKEYREKSINKNITVSEEAFKEIEKSLNNIINIKYTTHSYNTSYNGEIYGANIKGSDERSFHILLNNQYELATNMYFMDTTSLNLFSEPLNGSIIGNFFIKDFGLVYYNLYGDIIWITYCK